MLVCRGTGNVGPDRTEPPAVVLLRDARQVSLLLSGLAIGAVLAEHEDVFDVVLDDSVRLKGFAKERRTVLDFVRGVGNLVPKDRRKVVVADSSAAYGDVRVKRYNHMPTMVPAPRNT